MYTFKLLDTVLQGTTFLSGLILLIVFQAEGYFYWINLGLIVWILISMILNLFLVKPIQLLRVISSVVLLLLIVIFGVSYFSGVRIPRLNFYFRPISLIIIIFYFFISMFEMLKMKSRGEIGLDF